MVNFILGFHCHQPVGNFDSVFKDVHEKSYSPLIRTLSSSNLKFSFHATGILLEWWEKNDPELINIIAKGVESEQIELLGGGYYEPILAAIPRMDRAFQLEMLNKALKRLFGKYPKGAWIAERIWQPDIIRDLTEAGLKYAFLDDFQFIQAGIAESDMDNIFRTEYDGVYLDLFPIHERLRYKIPFANPGESFNEALYLDGRESNLSVMFDDGEKMGAWPDTYDWVYGKGGYNGWLQNFIDLAGGSFQQIKFELPSDILNNTPERIPVYLPISSYREMGEWTLPVEKRHSYDTIKNDNPSAPLGEGIWHNFLVRYPEANLLHKRAAHLSGKIHSLMKTGNKKVKRALFELLKSQANDAYWHGVFGGIYLPHLRRAVHKAFISSYLLYKDAIGSDSEIDREDLDMDGENELQISNGHWLIVYKPSDASFLALDYLENGLIHSLGDIFCLHNEYDITKLKGESFKKEAAGMLDGGQKKDDYEKPPQTIHEDAKYPSDLTMDDLITYTGLLPSFEILFEGRKIGFKEKSVRKSSKSITIETAGFLKGVGENDIFINLKTKIAETVSFAVNSKPASITGGNLDIIMRFAFPGGDGPSVSINAGGEIKGLMHSFKNELNYFDENIIYLTDSFWGGSVEIKAKADSNFSKHYRFASRPLTTISLSEDGFERIFQGIEIKYSFNLVTGELFDSIIEMSVRNIKTE